MTTNEQQTLIGEAVLTAPQHTQAWDGQLSLVVGFAVGAADRPADRPAAAMSRGEELDVIMGRMDAAYAAWREAGYPNDGPTVVGKDAVYADLRALTGRIKPPVRHRLAGYPAAGFTTYICTCLHESTDMAAHDAHAALEG